MANGNKSSSFSMKALPFSAALIPVVSGLVFSDDRFARASIFAGATGLALLLELLAGRRAKVRGGSSPKRSLPRLSLFFVLAVAWCPLSVLLAARGLDLRVFDPVFGGVFLILMALAGSGASIPGRVLLFLGASLSPSLVALLPADPALAGVETLDRDTDVLVTWSLDGARAKITPALDPPSEVVNARVTVRTVEARWEAELERREELVRAGGSCLDLAEDFGEEGLVEALSWMALSEKGEIPEDLFECPAARRVELERSLARRLDARGEELAAREAMAAGNPRRAASRARLALEISGGTGFAKALLAGIHLREGIRETRVGGARGSRA